MIDEIQMLLDSMKNVPDFAVWTLIGYLIYKLVAYLSLTGSVVYVIKILCSTFLAHKNAPKLYNFKGITLTESVEDNIKSLLQEITVSGGTGYLHNSDVNSLRSIYREHIKKAK